MKIYETSQGYEEQRLRLARDLERIQGMYIRGEISEEIYRRLLILSGNYTTSGSG